jgi:L-iditol 2-dehydrogenase
MKMAVLSKPYDLAIRDVATPKPIGEQVLVKLKAAGICGSDLECYTGKSKEGRYDIAPYVPGHEWSGEVMDTGEKALTLRKGDKVTGDCVLHCGNCENCKSGLSPASCRNMREVGFRPDSPGGMGEYLVLEERYLHKLPMEMSFEEGALVEPFSVPYFGIWGEGGHVDASDEVVIFGAGPIGLLALVVAKMAGAKVTLVEKIEKRVQMGRKLGADHLLDPTRDDLKQAVFDLTQGRGADLVVEASGNDGAIASCFDVAGFGARIRLIGHSIGRKVPSELGLTIWKGLFIHGQAGAPFFFPKTIRFMSQARKQIDYSQIITHRFPFAQLLDAFKFAEEKKDEAIKVMIGFDH